MSGSVQAEQASIRLRQPLRVPHELIVSGRLTDFIARPVRQSVLFTPPGSIHFLVVVQAGLCSQRVMLSEIGMELTSQTVVFAFFV